MTILPLLLVGLISTVLSLINEVFPDATQLRKMNDCSF